MNVAPRVTAFPETYHGTLMKLSGFPMNMDSTADSGTDSDTE